MKIIENARNAAAIASIVATTACDITTPSLNAFMNVEAPRNVQVASTYDVKVKGIGTEGVPVGYIMLISDKPQGVGKDTVRVDGNYLNTRVHALNQPGVQGLKVIIGGNRLPTKTGLYQVNVE